MSCEGIFFGIKKELLIKDYLDNVGLIITGLQFMLNKKQLNIVVVKVGIMISIFGDIQKEGRLKENIVVRHVRS